MFEVRSKDLLVYKTIKLCVNGASAPLTLDLCHNKHYRNACKDLLCFLSEIKSLRNRRIKQTHRAYKIDGRYLSFLKKFNGNKFMRNNFGKSSEHLNILVLVFCRVLQKLINAEITTFIL